MNKLTLEHLAGYLPYKLMVVWTGDINAELIQTDGTNCDLWFDESKYNTSLKFIQPILRPLSDLTKEIEVGGEKFVPSDRTQVGMQHGRISSNIGIVQNRITTNTISYYDMVYLMSLHFDVFELISEGLAIDINTLKTI